MRTQTPEEKERERRTILVAGALAVLPRLGDALLELCAVVVRSREKARQLVLALGLPAELLRDLRKPISISHGTGQ